MKIFRPFFLIFSLIAFASSQSWAAREILFEGYSKITVSGVHAGYFVGRYEFDSTAQKFYATTYTKTSLAGVMSSESVKAVSDSEMNPISYEYTALDNKVPKTIDAVFANGKMKATINDGGKIKKLEESVPKGVFLSGFLIYLMLKSKAGLQASSTYNYRAIAEEDAKIFDGKSVVGSMEGLKGQQAYKITNDFKGMKFTSFVTQKGEILSVLNPTQGVTEELMAKPGDATGAFGLDASIMNKLFGAVPVGNKNVLSQQLQTEVIRPDKLETKAQEPKKEK